MTSLIAWAGVDGQKVASVYLASDSRITWPSGHHWDQAKKVFSSIQFPDVLGFSGDVVSMSTALNNCISLADRFVLFDKETNSRDRQMVYRETIKAATRSYPSNIETSVIGISREGAKSTSEFIAWKMTLKEKNWSEHQIEMPKSSDILAISGTGEAAIKNSLARYESKSKHPASTQYIFKSRDFACALIDAIKMKEDRFSGGAPQISGIHSVGNSKIFGMIFEGVRYISGIPFEPTGALKNCEWFNENFERYDGVLGEMLPGAQIQRRP